jgi:hypothetical protein
MINSTSLNEVHYSSLVQGTRVLSIEDVFVLTPFVL